MPSIKKKVKLSTNLASLKRPNKVTWDEYDPSYFPLPATRYPVGTPSNAKRSRKYYSDLADEREFLIHLKEIWVRKLEALKEDHKALTRMKNVTKQEVENVQPLFSQEDLELDTDISKPTESSSSQPQPELITTLEQLNQLNQASDSLFEFSEEELEEDDLVEDEEEARQALTLMLKEFGDLI